MLAPGIIGLSSMLIFTPSLLSGAIIEITALIIYVAICAILVTIATRLLKSVAIIQSFGLFLILSNIFFGGVLLNLHELSPLLGRVQYVFPLFWYVEFVSL